MMVYLSADISGLTRIVGTFFVNGYRGLSANFLASSGYWTMMLWSQNIPISYLVDLFWQHKAKLIDLGRV